MLNLQEAIIKETDETEKIFCFKDMGMSLDAKLNSNGRNSVRKFAL